MKFRFVEGLRLPWWIVLIALTGWTGFAGQPVEAATKNASVAGALGSPVGDLGSTGRSRAVRDGAACQTAAVQPGDLEDAKVRERGEDRALAERKGAPDAFSPEPSSLGRASCLSATPFFLQSSASCEASLLACCPCASTGTVHCGAGGCEPCVL